MKTNILTTVCLACAFLAGCANEDELTISSADKDWYAVEDLPGELNQARYEVYRDYGINLLVSDTLGQKLIGTDINGDPQYLDITYDFTYSVYKGLDTTMVFECSQDEEALLKAVNVVKQYVLPYLPTEQVMRPKVIFLAKYIGTKGQLLMGYNNVYETTALPYYADAYNGVAVADIEELKDKDVDSPEWRYWAGFILGANAQKWLNANYADEVTEWTNLTPLTMLEEDAYALTKIPGTDIMQFQISWMGYTPKESFGMFRWRLESKVQRSYVKIVNGEEVTVNEDPIDVAQSLFRTDDLADFIAYYYIYLNREEEFEADYAAYPNILTKMEAVKPLIAKFEEAGKVTYK